MTAATAIKAATLPICHGLRRMPVLYHRRHRAATVGPEAKMAAEAVVAQCGRCLIPVIQRSSRMLPVLIAAIAAFLFACLVGLPATSQQTLTRATVWDLKLNRPVASQPKWIAYK